MEPTEELVKLILPYRVLVLIVELSVEGKIVAGDLATLNKMGWSFRVTRRDKIRAISCAIAEKERLFTGLELCREQKGGVVIKEAPLAGNDLRSRIERDDEVFAILDPKELGERVAARRSQPTEQKGKVKTNTLSYAQRKNSGKEK